MLRRLFRLIPGATKGPAERRRWMRREPAPSVTGEATLGGAAVAVTVINLSQGGACLALGRSVARGDRLRLRLFNHSCLWTVTADARVAWAEADGGLCRVGCQFDRPLPLRELQPMLS